MKRREFAFVLIGLPPIIHQVAHGVKRAAELVIWLLQFLGREFTPS